MRILVVGAGATGGYFGARLAQAGRDVTFLVRPARAEKLRTRGLRILEGSREETLDAQLVTADGLTEPYDLVLLSIKAMALGGTLDDLTRAVGPSTVIVPFLNGLGHVDALNARYGADRVLGGVVKIAAGTNDDGDILFLGGITPSLEIGEQDGGLSERIRDVAAELTVDGFELIVSPDIMAAMWQKWVFIVSLTATTALMGGTVGEVAAVPDGASVGTAIVAEAAAVSAGAGYAMPTAAIDAVTGIATQTGSALTTSLYRDLTAGRATETEPMVGDFVARARDFGVQTPVLDLAVVRLRVYESRRRRSVEG